MVGFEKTGAIGFYEDKKAWEDDKNSQAEECVENDTNLRRFMLFKYKMSKMTKTMSSVIIITELSGALCPTEMQLECNEEAVGAPTVQEMEKKT